MLLYTKIILSIIFTGSRKKDVRKKQILLFLSDVSQSHHTRNEYRHEPAGQCMLIVRIWHDSSVICVAHMLSFLFSRIRDHAAVGQTDVNYSLSRTPHLFIVLHK
jgi:hypothetical protein